MSTHIIRFKAICMMAVSAILTASVVLSVMLAAGCGGNGNDGGGTPGASGKASETRQPLDNSSNPASETAAADDAAMVQLRQITRLRRMVQLRQITRLRRITQLHQVA